MEEIKFIPGTGNAYSCDKQGNIYSHYVPGSHMITIEPQKKMAAWTGKNNDYLLVTFSLNGQKSNQLVHRLIGKTWIDNPNNYLEIDHINNNVQDNRVGNLQWCSHKMNIDKQEIDKGSLNGLRSHTKLYRENGELIGEFASMKEACKYASQFGCSISGMQKYHKSKGYYIEADNTTRREVCSQRLKSKWDLYGPENNFIATFNSKREAGRYIKENIRDISIKLFSDKGKAYNYYVIEKSVETK